MGRIINLEKGRTETMEMRLRYGTKERVLWEIGMEKCRFPEMYFLRTKAPYMQYEMDRWPGGEDIISHYLMDWEKLVYPVIVEEDTIVKVMPERIMYLSEQEFPTLLKIMTAKQAGEMAMWLIETEDGGFPTTTWTECEESTTTTFYKLIVLTIYEKLQEIEMNI